MSALKSGPTLALDEVARLADELMERMDTVLALELDDETLQKALRDGIAALRPAVHELRVQRRARAELPAAGNIESAEVDALTLKARAFFTGTPEAEVVAARIRDDCGELCKAIACASDALGNDDLLYGALGTMQAAVTRIVTSLAD